MSLTKSAVSLSLALLASAFSSSALAAEPLKIGMVLPLSGPYAAYGQQIERGARVYLQQHGGNIAGRKVELILKDDTGVAPEVSKRVAQELLSTHKVDILAGFGLTPGALAVAPLATAARKPMIVMNAAASKVTTQSNYIVRVSQTLPQVTAPLATWSAMNRVRKVFTLVSDYGPGHDAETEFKRTFKSLGGEIVGDARIPVGQLDFVKVLPRIKATQPDAVFLFVPPGEQTVAFTKAFAQAGLDKAGVRIIATGDLTEEGSLDAMGDSALGLITAHHYSENHNSPENKAYVKDYTQAYPASRPNYMSVGGYDGLQLIAKVLAKTGGDASGDRFVATAKGLSWTSPRGVMSIDASTRDVVQTVYIRKVQRVNGKLQNVEFDKVANVKDPGKE
ncbi:MAG: ABC transporter substrate-binding protein [Aquabacterium sp.]|jgi:branched-chain amino acid transport system substrate-binding protein